MNSSSPTERYFASVEAALDGLDVFLRDESSPFYRHTMVAEIVVHYLERLKRSFDCWRNHVAYSSSFRISQTESGYPVYQNVLSLENDAKKARERLKALAKPEILRQEMADFILRHRSFPVDLQKSMYERLYLETISKGAVFSPFVLPQTIKVSTNPKTKRPLYYVHWGAFDGASNLPLIYMAALEDSTDNIVQKLVTREGKLNKKVPVELPIPGILNPDLAHKFDDFIEKNSAYSLTPATIAHNMDQDFDTLHPKQLRRIVLGPFYSAGITAHNQRVSDVLNNVRKTENAWILTWTVQEVFSRAEQPAKRGLWSSTPAHQEFHIETSDLEAVQQGVSLYEKHALVPHEAYQALYASGEVEKVFGGYQTHIISRGQVISDV